MPRRSPRHSRRDFYDLRLPNLSPELVAEALASRDEKAWNAFKRKFRKQMSEPEAAHLLDLLAALSHQTNFSLGFYCEDELRCHRSVLRELLLERGAEIM